MLGNNAVYGRVGRSATEKACNKGLMQVSPYMVTRYWFNFSAILQISMALSAGTANVIQLVCYLSLSESVWFTVWPSSVLSLS